MSAGCSRTPEPTAVLSARANETSLAGFCGRLDDGLVHVPPHYNDFTPPQKGASYADPQYGCPILRLTDGKSQFHEAVHHQYSTISAINQDDSLAMLVTGSGQALITDLKGNVVVAPGDFPETNSSNIPWDRHAPQRFYFTNGNTIFKGIVDGGKVSSAPLHTFPEYKSVIIPDEEDLSDDGDHLWLVGDTQAFLFTIGSGAKGPAISVGAKDQGCSWHKIQITPSNKMLIAWSCDGSAREQGQEIYSADGTLFRHMFNSSIHTDVGRDQQGNEVAVVSRIPDTYKDACPHRGGADVIGIDPPHTARCLIDVNWVDTHISMRAAAQGWVALSFFDQGKCPDYSCFYPGLLSRDWESKWKHFSEELVLVRMDGSAVLRLAHHRSRSAEYYWAQSRASISRDGKYVIFDSNMNRNDTGVADYTDVYLIKVW